MKRILKRLALIVALLLLALIGYSMTGWFDARADAPMLRERVARLRAAGQGAAELLGPDKRAILLRIEDPTFDTNNGTDFSTPGAGQTTITQSLSKRLGFKDFKPGLRKFRQTGYAIGLTSRLSKEEILTLFLAESPFKARDGRWIKGFDAASVQFFGTPLAKLDRDRFILLSASGIAPARLHPDAPNAELIDRVRRIDRLLAGDCRAAGHGDSFLKGCK